MLLSVSTQRVKLSRAVTPSQRAAGQLPRLLPFVAMLVEARHQLDEIAGAEAVVELVPQNVLPGIAAGAGRAGQREEVGAAGDAGGRPRLDRRRADLLEG